MKFKTGHTHHKTFLGDTLYRALSSFVGILILAVAFFVTPQPTHAQDSLPNIQAIAVEGAARVEPETVRSYLLVREGDPFDLLRVDRSLKSLFATGLFADVRFRREGNTLVVIVVENPVINRIAIEGNQRINDEELLTELSLKPRVIYTRSKVQGDVDRIQTIYQKSGRFAVTVEPKIIQLPQNRVDLVFEVDEGNLTEVQNIRFVGNRAFDDGDLQDIVRTRETRWYRFLSQDDRYDPDRINFDRELLRRYYLRNGYADFRVLSSQAELTPDRNQFFITFTLEEGQRYRFGEVSVEANLRDLDAAQLQGVLKSEAGAWYDSTIVDDNVEALTAAAGNFGYAFVDVRPKVDRDRETGVINITYQVQEGPRVFVERINVLGNVRTLDEVVRREFRVVEGDAFSASRLRASLTRIQDLDFFSNVTIEEAQGSAPDKAVVNVTVEEKSTGSLSIGGGYSTSNGALADFSIRERNLLGRGQDLSLSMQVSQRQSQIDLSFTEPYFLDREVAAGFDVYHTKTDQQKISSFNSEQTGGGVRFDYPITSRLHQNWSYTLKSTKVSGVKDTASSLIKAQEGQNLLSVVGHGLFYDRRNSKVTPTEGYFLGMKNELAGVGGDTSFLRNTFSGGYYYNIADGFVLSTRGRVGSIVGIGEDVGIMDRFFLGGDNLRGFASSGVGPRDSVSKDALGGEVFYNAGAEVSVPLGLPKELGITGKVFSDIGSLFEVNPSSATVQDDASLRASAGMGLAWVSPVGPISLDFAQAFMKQSYDKTEVMRINFGTKF